MKLLVTAFGAFPGMPLNPSERVVAGVVKRHARRLAALGIDLVTAVLPVVYATVAEELSRLVAEHRPDAVILVGVAGRRRQLSIETRALNRIGTLRPDARRAVSRTPCVCAGAPVLRMSRWPAARLAAALRARGIAAAVSIDAGDYLCNQALYCALAGTTGPVGFLHIPRPRGRRRRSRPNGSPRPTLDQMIVGLASMIVIMGIECRRRA